MSKINVRIPIPEPTETLNGPGTVYKYLIDAHKIAMLFIPVGFELTMNTCRI